MDVSKTTNHPKTNNNKTQNKNQNDKDNVIEQDFKKNNEETKTSFKDTSEVN